jgi:hypothetical protein
MANMFFIVEFDLDTVKMLMNIFVRFFVSLGILELTDNVAGHQSQWNNRLQWYVSISERLPERSR